MTTKTDIELKNFFIFNSRFGPKEGEELKKILYYFPATDCPDIQIKNVGLVEGIIQFTSTFKPSKPVNSLHTQKMKQLYYRCEQDFWMVLTLQVPTIVTNKEGSSHTEYLDDNVQDNVYEAILEQSYYMYRLFCDTFEHTLEAEDVETLKTKLEHFYKSYLKSLKLIHSDILNIFSGIQYLPLDKLTFLKVQGFINSLECNYPEVEYTSFLFNDHLIWSGLEPNDMKTIYQYLIGTLLPANMETELQGGSMPRDCSSPFAALYNGRFITGPENLGTVKSVGKDLKIYLFSSEKPSMYHLLVYRTFSASLCLLVKGDTDLSLQFLKDLDGFLSPKMTGIVSDISEYCSKQVLTPSNIPENSPRFIYFNKLNLAYKSTVHLDNKQTGNIAVTKDSLRIMADLHSRKSTLGHSGETIVKTMNDYWVVAKNSNLREFYIALQQKNASLIDISEEVKKLCDSELRGIFFHPI